MIYSNCNVYQLVHTVFYPYYDCIANWILIEYLPNQLEESVDINY